VAPKNKLALCIIIAVSGLLISVVSYSGIGLIAVPLMVFFVLDIGVPWGKPPKSDLRVQRKLGSPKALVDEPVLVELTIMNRGEEIERLTLEDTVPEGAKLVRGSTFLECGLKSGEEATLRYEVSLSQPIELRFGDCRVGVQSAFGLTEEKLALTAPASLRVYPKLLPRKMATGRAKAFTWTGSAPSKLRGGRADFMDIRGYVFGDPFRDVNWRASARLGKKVVNEWSPERGLDCIIVVDLSSENLPVVGDWSARGEVITCTYELASSLVASGNRVGMLILGSTVARIKPGFGSRHLRRMLDQLVNSLPGSVWKVQRIEEFLETFFRTQYRNSGGTLFFISAGISMPLFEAVKTLSTKRFSCTCVFVNTLASEKAAVVREKVVKKEAEEAGIRVARAELDWFELQFETISKVYEWGIDSGFTGIGKVVVR